MVLAMNLSTEALDAAIDTYLGGHNPGANREHLRAKFQAFADALTPHIVQQFLETEGRREWQVTGDPGQPYGAYRYQPRGLDAEEKARAFIALFKERDRAPWVDGPNLSYRRAYEGPWIEEKT